MPVMKAQRPDCEVHFVAAWVEPVVAVAAVVDVLAPDELSPPPDVAMTTAPAARASTTIPSTTSRVRSRLRLRGAAGRPPDGPVPPPFPLPLPPRRGGAPPPPVPTAAVGPDGGPAAPATAPAPAAAPTAAPAA